MPDQYFRCKMASSCPLDFNNFHHDDQLLYGFVILRGRVRRIFTYGIEICKTFFIKLFLQANPSSTSAISFFALSMHGLSNWLVAPVTKLHSGLHDFAM